MRALIVVVIAACDIGSKPAELPAEPPPIELAVHMKRNFCYGRCAGYSIDIANDGTVTFVGEAHVAANHGTRKISRDRMRALGELIDAADFFELGDAYGATECGSYVWKETMTIKVVRAGKTKLVERYHGCESAPAGLALDDLANAIELVTESIVWIGQPKNG